MRLPILDAAGPPKGAGPFVSDMRRILSYRPELLGAQLSELIQYVLRDSPSEWTVGERELIAAFVAGQSQCPF
jgi:hypothetical protein